MAKSVLTDLNLNKNELQNAVIQNLASAPNSPVKGQHYFNTTDNTEYVWNGTAWVDALNQGEVLTFSTPLVKTGTNVTINAATTSAAGIIELATDAEASTGTDTTRAINAKQLATKVTANAAITAGTACKITYDAKGLVTGGAALQSSDIPDISATYVPQTSVGVAKLFGEVEDYITVEAPRNLEATPTSTSSIRLTWDVATNATSYNI